MNQGSFATIVPAELSRAFSTTLPRSSALAIHRKGIDILQLLKERG